MPFLLQKITVLCFAASYAVALGLELWRLVAPRPILRYVSLGFGAAGLLAHVAFLLVEFVRVEPYPLLSPAGSLFFLALILAVFYFYGAIHHYHLAWSLFVLPLVLGLIALAVLGPSSIPAASGVPFWGDVHGYLVLLAAVGICVAFVASVMYLVQVHRLKAKLAPGKGMPLWNLERLEMMNRRALFWAFPLLSAGLIVGVALQIQSRSLLEGWDSPKILGALGLWIVFAILFYLRYIAHARGRQLAWLTMIAFALLILALIAPDHPFVHGGGR